jgi:hypothetical protein
MTLHKSAALHLGICIGLFVLCYFTDPDELMAMLTGLSIMITMVMGTALFLTIRQNNRIWGLVKKAYVEMSPESHAKIEDAIREDTGCCPNIVIFGLGCKQGLMDDWAGGCSACGVKRCKKG